MRRAAPLCLVDDALMAAEKDCMITHPNALAVQSNQCYVLILQRLLLRDSISQALDAAKQRLDLSNEVLNVINQAVSGTRRVIAADDVLDCLFVFFYYNFFFSPIRFF